MDAQLAAMNEQSEEERMMMQARWKQQMDEIATVHAAEKLQTDRRLLEAEATAAELRDEKKRLVDRVERSELELADRLQRLEAEHRVALKSAGEAAQREAELRRQQDEEYERLKQQYDDLLAMIEPFRVRNLDSSTSCFVKN